MKKNDYEQKDYLHFLQLERDKLLYEAGLYRTSFKDSLEKFRRAEEYSQILTQIKTPKPNERIFL